MQHQSYKSFAMKHNSHLEYITLTLALTKSYDH
uniref:Uncharacterized protein n=1 Tax=Rhizophora mucronata TaxID=61149 RepID=A0A2P2NPC5_RHIMU